MEFSHDEHRADGVRFKLVSAPQLVWIGVVHEQCGDLAVGPDKALDHGDTIQQVQPALDRVGHVVPRTVVPIKFGS